MSAGLGALSAFGVAVQNSSTPSVGVDAAVFYPMSSENVRADRTPVPSGSIVGDSMVSAVAMGISNVEGNFQMEIEGSVSGHAIWLWNGDDGYTHAAISTSAYSSVAPTLGTASSGGALPAGALKWAVSVVMTRTVGGDVQKIIFPMSALSTAATIAPTNQTLVVTWAAPVAPLAEYTVAGYMIWRTLVGGSTPFFVKYQAGTGLTYTDDGSLTLNQDIQGYSASLYSHIMVGSPPVSGDRLKCFSATANHNNEKANRFNACRMDSMKLSVGGMDDKMMGEFALKGAEAELVDNFTPVFVPLEPMLGWHCSISLNGYPDQTLESFELDCANNVSVVPGMRTKAFNRDTISGARMITGQMTRQFQDNLLWSQMMRGNDFSLKFTSFGQCVANPVKYGINVSTVNGGVDAIPFQFFITIELPRCKINKAGGNATSPERIIETVAFNVFKDQVTGTDMKITMLNTTAQYQ